MVRTCAFLIFLLLPLTALGATLRADDSLRITEIVQGNAYLAGAEVEIVSALPADLLASATLIRILSSVAGDVLLAGGTVSIDGAVLGDARVVAGQINVSEPISGEFAGLARHIRVESTLQEVRIAGGTVELLGGAAGPVTIYGNKVTLAGNFKGSVRVVAADTITVLDGTQIEGIFEYNAPQEAIMPDGTEVHGGVKYIGSSSFLPTPEEAQAFAIAGFGIYFIVRIVAGMLAVGLLVGLFSVFSSRLIHEVTRVSARQSISLCVLGFAVLIGVPFLSLFLAVSVVGVGLAIILASAYILALILAYLFGVAVLGALLSRFLLKRHTPSWPDAIAGLLVLYLLNLIPVVGFLVNILLLSCALGALVQLFYRFAFSSTIHD